jgi:copper transport protein
MLAIIRRLLLATGVLIAVLSLGTGVASAHASVVATSPADNTSVTPSPAKVSATFSEQVSIGVGGLTVRNANGLRVDQGSSSLDSAGSTVSVALQPALPDGTYVATYRVLSADGHPVSASFLFGVGAGPIDANAASFSGTDGNRAWEIAGAFARFLMYASALLAAGLAFFLAFIHDRDEDRWRLIGWTRIATITALFGATGIVVVQAALLSGKNLSAITDSGVLGDVLNSRLGWSLAALTMGLIAVHLSTDIRNVIASQSLALYGGLATAASFAIWGHSTELTPIWLSTTADIVHVAAAAIWFGGIVGLVMVLRRRGNQPVASTAQIVSRFSTAAAISVGFLAAAGIALGWNATGGSFEALVSTTYGRLLLVKIVITAGILAIAGYNRSWLVPAIVQREAELATTSSEAEQVTEIAEPDQPDRLDQPAFTEEQRAKNWSLLRRAVTIEAIALVVIMGVTSVLVNVTPARTAIATADRVVNQTQTVATGSVNLVVVPARVGRNTLHIQYADSSGKPIDVANTLTIEFSLPSANLSAISRQTAKAGPGHFIYTGPELSIAGTWTVTFVARTSDFSEQRTQFQVPITK